MNLKNARLFYPYEATIFFSKKFNMCGYYIFKLGETTPVISCRYRDKDNISKKKLDKILLYQMQELTKNELRN